MGQAGQGISQISNTGQGISNVAANPFQNAPSAFSGFGGGGSSFFKRGKRQIMIGGDNAPGFLSQTPRPSFGGAGGISGLLSPAVSNLGVTTPTFGQQLQPVDNILGQGSELGNNDGSGTVRLWYKGCVRLSMLETLAGSHCKLEPELADIRFFSQQSLLEPLMTTINSLNQFTSATGTETKVDGLCYIMKKEFSKLLWNSLQQFSPLSSGSSSGGAGGALGQIAGLGGSLLGKK